MKWLWPAALAAVLLGTMPARADLKLCNRTSYILYAATAAVKGATGEADGWTRIVPGDCQTARSGPLAPATTLIHARSSLAHSGPARAWGGGVPLCVRDAHFVLRQAMPARACAEGSFPLSFAALDTHGARDWTMTLDETPALPSLTAAQLAGVKRLLRDNGYGVGAVDGAPDRRTGAALAAFRKRIPPAADNAALFAALEREALKSNAPSGYTVCNDGGKPLQVALAEAGAAPVSRGWWAVAPGACARAITTALARDAVYLLARTGDGKVVAGGTAAFCIAEAAFEIRGTQDCGRRGFAQAGFLATRTAGLDGYVAHVTEKGLTPAGGAPRPAQASISK